MYVHNVLYSHKLKLITPQSQCTALHTVHTVQYSTVPVDLPDLGGPTTASLTGTGKPGTSCWR